MTRIHRQLVFSTVLGIGLVLTCLAVQRAALVLSPSRVMRTLEVRLGQNSPPKVWRLTFENEWRTAGEVMSGPVAWREVSIRLEPSARGSTLQEISCSTRELEALVSSLNQPLDGPDDRTLHRVLFLAQEIAETGFQLRPTCVSWGTGAVRETVESTPWTALSPSDPHVPTGTFEFADYRVETTLRNCQSPFLRWCSGAVQLAAIVVFFLAGARWAQPSATAECS